MTEDRVADTAILIFASVSITIATINIHYMTKVTDSRHSKLFLSSIWIIYKILREFKI